jgi:phage terminase large subunit-like protein
LKIDYQAVYKLLEKKNTRVALCEQSLYWFGWFYFNHYFTHKSARFHLEMAQDMQFEEGFRFLIEEKFRESAKTAWAKLKMIHAICYKKKHFIQYVCFEQKKSEGHLYDIALELQTNNRLINDFGQLFYGEEFDEKHSKKKSIKEFITENGIKIKAASTGVSTRGDIYREYRPDLYVIDDFENEKTKYSPARTQQVLMFIDELLSGISADANVIFLCNKISLNGSVNNLERRSAGNPDWKLSKTPVEIDGKIQWRAKFVRTDKEKEAINSKLEDSKLFVASLEERKRTLGSSRYMQEYMNQPIADDVARYHPRWIQENYYNQLPILTQCRIVMAVDPNASEKKTADQMGICVMAIDKNTRLRYVLECVGFRFTIDKQLGIIKEIYDKWQPQKIGIEAVMNQTSLYDLASAENYFRLQKLSPKSKDKIARSSYVEPLVENGIIKFNPSHIALEEQLLQFPNDNHDDLVDAFLYANEMLNGSGARINKEKTASIAGNIMSKQF